jgi:ABC-type uncharacterized transport system substrate-binding protein
MKTFPHAIAASIVLLTSVNCAQAHPHVWVTVTSEIVIDQKGAMTGVRHSWQFDDMYSTFALEGLKSKTKGVFTREELAPLAKVNIESLKDSDFFTFAKVAGKDVAFADATDYWLGYKKEGLTLYFTLPFKNPVTEKNLVVEVYDPSYFVALEFAEKNAVTLTGAPSKCSAKIEKPNGAAQTQQLSESSFMQGNMGQSFASRIAVRCP